VDIARLHVDWTLDAQPGAEPQRRLDALVTDLREQALEHALSSTDDGPGLTCLRAVVVPAVTVRWAAADRELVDTWAGAIGRAVASARRGRDPETVVRYPTRAAALADVVVSLLQGDLSRSWAWDLLGVGPGARRAGRPHPWPAAASGAAGPEDRRPGADVTPVPGRGAAGVVAAVAALAEEAPEAVLPLVVTLARRHLLASFAGALGGPGLIALVTRAGGPAASTDPPTAARERDDTGRRTDTPATTAVLALVRMVQDRSAVLAAARASGLVTGPSNQPGMPDNGRTRTAGPAQAPAVVTPGENAPSAPDPRTEPPATWTPPADATVARALAAFALLEVEPAYAAHPLGRAAARMLCDDPAQPSPASGANPAAAPRRADDQEGPRAEAPTPPAQVASGAGPPAAGAEPATPGPQTPPTPIAGGPAGSTAWGGLLFLLRLTGETGLPDRVIADPGRFGVGLRSVLHRLGAELISLAAPDAGPVNPQDPALLAFCGLAAEAGPPEAAADGRADWLDAELGRVLVRLRERLEGTPVAESSDQRLLLTVLRRRARVSVEPGWVDVELDLDEVSTTVRRAGLDLDPGHLPWLGVVVRFRYV
jgi:hypothetical protein